MGGLKQKPTTSSIMILGTGTIKTATARCTATTTPSTGMDILIIPTPITIHGTATTDSSSASPSEPGSGMIPGIAPEARTTPIFTHPTHTTVIHSMGLAHRTTVSPSITQDSMWITITYGFSQEPTQPALQV